MQDGTPSCRYADAVVADCRHGNRIACHGCARRCESDYKATDAYWTALDRGITGFGAGVRFKVGADLRDS